MALGSKVYISWLLGIDIMNTGFRKRCSHTFKLRWTASNLNVSSSF